MTNIRERQKTLIDAIERKNTIPEPAVRPVTLEVRTALGFSLKTNKLQALLADRKGATAFHVVWEYRVHSDRLNRFSMALQQHEKALFDAKGKFQYLGTYMMREDPQDVPTFFTKWACGNEDDARAVARGPWNGPPGAEQAFKQLFSPDFFNHGKARITTQGLAAAADLGSDE